MSPTDPLIYLNGTSFVATRHINGSTIFPQNYKAITDLEIIQNICTAYDNFIFLACGLLFVSFIGNEILKRSGHNGSKMQILLESLTGTIGFFISIVLLGTFIMGS